MGLSRYDRLPFYFDRRAVTTVLSDGVFSFGSGVPDLAFVHLDTLQSLRDKYIYHPRKPGLIPNAGLKRKKLRQIQPPNAGSIPAVHLDCLGPGPETGRTRSGRGGGGGSRSDMLDPRSFTRDYWPEGVRSLYLHGLF